MIKIIRQKKPVKPEIGDILYGQRYAFAWWEKEKESLKSYEWITLADISVNRWRALERLGIDISKVQEEFIYECPFHNGNKYYWFIPSILLSRDVNKYRKNPNDKYSREAIAFDQEWINKMFKQETYHEDNIVKSMLGHGYTDCTLPYDGNGQIELVVLELNNGDFIMGPIWVWFNK